MTLLNLTCFAWAEILAFSTKCNFAETSEIIYLIRPRFRWTNKVLSWYVDDLISDADNINDAKLFIEKCKQWLLEANLDLRKFKSNSNKIPDDQKFATSNTKVLVIKWENDYGNTIIAIEYIFHCFPKVLTKQNVIHSTASIFDLLGLITPVFIIFKEL